MPTISGGTVMPGFGPYLFAAPPGAAVSNVQTLTQSGSISAGTFRLSFKGSITAPIVYTATAAVIDAAIELLPTVGAGNVVTGGGPLPGTPVTFTFSGGNLAGQNLPLIQVDNSGLTGGSFTVANTTPGGPASGPNALQGAIGIDTSSGLQYNLVGGTWTKTGLQTLRAGVLTEPEGSAEPQQTGPAKRGGDEEEPDTEDDDADEPDEEAPPDETEEQRTDREQRREERRQRREQRREERRNPVPTPHESRGKAVKKPPEDKSAR